MADKYWLWLLVVIGGPCFIVFILLCACLIMHRRARTLGVLTQRHYSFYVGGLILPPPKNIGTVTCPDPATTGSQTEILDDATSASANSTECSPFINTTQPTTPDMPLLEN
ncbi:hypothetical protein OUZ56_030877 [Daphnia magna]|uniref:Uncharacterized protein n=1 Tax=Daphnia magna TaxID=35525 RepID=A0ABQ9ZTG2_9CRUS|nr:hypothetical protein OUZ56_030877 [Daphnia magna]